MTCLAEWIAPLTIDQFVRMHLQQAPFASPSTGSRSVALLDWSVVDRVLAAAAPADVLVCARGGLVPDPVPRSVAELRGLMDRGIGLCIRRAEGGDDGLRALAADFATGLPSDVHVQLFVTPGGTHGFGWHWDEEDVFIVQTRGQKQYFFRENTVDRSGDFARFHDERSPLMTAELLAGDVLYIPARWWHMARCVTDSLSISIGARPRFSARGVA